MIAECHDARDEQVAVALWRLLHMTLLPPLTARIATGGLIAAQREGLHDEP
jgi:hypothetical protein